MMTFRSPPAAAARNPSSSSCKEYRPLASARRTRSTSPIDAKWRSGKSAASPRLLRTRRSFALSVRVKRAKDMSDIILSDRKQFGRSRSHKSLVKTVMPNGCGQMLRPTAPCVHPRASAASRDRRKRSTDGFSEARLAAFRSLVRFGGELIRRQVCTGPDERELHLKIRPHVSQVGGGQGMRHQEIVGVQRKMPKQIEHVNEVDRAIRFLSRPNMPGSDHHCGDENLVVASVLLEESGRRCHQPLPWVPVLVAGRSIQAPAVREAWKSRRLAEDDGERAREQFAREHALHRSHRIEDAAENARSERRVGERLVVPEEVAQALDGIVARDVGRVIEDAREIHRARVMHGLDEAEVVAVGGRQFRVLGQMFDAPRESVDDDQIVISAQSTEVRLDHPDPVTKLIERAGAMVVLDVRESQREALGHVTIALAVVRAARVQYEDGKGGAIPLEIAQERCELSRSIVSRYDQRVDVVHRSVGAFRLSHALGQVVIDLSSRLSLNRHAGSARTNSGWVAANVSAAAAGLSSRHSGRPRGTSWRSRMMPSVATM